MDYATITRQMVKMVVPYVKAAIAKDASNRYSLKEEWRLPAVKFNLPIGEYHDDVVNILSNGEFVFVWYNPFESTADNPICNGASLVPDKILGINLIPASIAHDAIYMALESIAKSFGVAQSVIRKLADDIFTSVNLAENDGKVGVKTISTITHWGVRLFGGIYHRHAAKIRTITTVLLVAICLTGCAGCVGSIFDPEDSYTSPVYAKEVQNANGH